MTPASPSSAATPDLTPQAAVQKIVDRLRERIRKGHLAPGQRLVEAELVAETGAPRTKVRDALRQLQHEGLVTIEPFRGASVRRLGREAIRQTYAVREALEGLAARLAAGRRNDDTTSLVEARGVLTRCAAAGDAMGFGEANRGWHEALLTLAANPVLEEALARLHTPVLRVMFQSFHAPEVVRRAERTLRDVTEAVLSGDGDAAETAMRRHVRDGLTVIDALDDDAFG